MATTFSGILPISYRSFWPSVFVIPQLASRAEAIITREQFLYFVCMAASLASFARGLVCCQVKALFTALASIGCMFRENL